MKSHGEQSTSYLDAMHGSLKRYGVDRWGEEFVGVNEAGHIVFRAPELPPVDLHALAQTLEAQGVRAPHVVRFPTMIEGRIRRLSEAFAAAVAENEYPAPCCGVLPIKVNQRRAVIDTVDGLSDGPAFGLEAGSKPELLLAMSRPPRAEVPLLVNGFKDREFIRMAYHAAELGHRVVVVLESLREVTRFIAVAREQAWKQQPDVGVRAKLYSRGSGRWQASGGEAAKFGLTTLELLAVARALRDAGLADRLALLHFHIGSQITRIKHIKTAVREAARLYSGLQADYAPNLRSLDVGGGLGVDYDGSRASHASSANYTVEEYANQVVFEVMEVVRETGAVAPRIITESGRALLAHHAVTVADLREVQGGLLPAQEPREGEHRVIAQLRETLEFISASNYEEYFHDALDCRDEALQLFSSGNLHLEDRAAAEGLFARVRLATKAIVDGLGRPAGDIVDHLAVANCKYLANFSVFQSLPDAWGIDQVFPAVPLSRHGERPTVHSEVIDITCDSDGCVPRFAHPKENLSVLPLHERRDAEPYYLAFFMTGAYQESLSNDHNLFGRTHEVVVRRETEPQAEGTRRLHFVDGLALDVRDGDTNGVLLAKVDFDRKSIEGSLRERHAGQETTLGVAWSVDLLDAYPYLSRTQGP